MPIFCRVAAMLLVLLIAGCASRAPLEIDPRWAFGYHGPSAKVLREAVPVVLQPADDDTTELIEAFERAHGIDRERSLRAAFEASFGAKDLRPPRGSRWVLQPGRVGLAERHFSGLMKPQLGANLSLVSASGEYLWHGAEFVDIGSPDLPYFTLEQLRDRPALLAEAWQAASQVLMRRLLAKYRSGVRDRREGYAD